VSHANAPAEVDAKVNAALARCDTRVKGGAQLLAAFKSGLVLPDVVKTTFLSGSQYAVW